MSTIFGLAERLSQLQNAIGDDTYVNLGTMVLPDVRGVSDLSALFDPQTTPQPGGIGVGGGPTGGTSSDTTTGIGSDGTVNKTKTKRGGSVNLVQPKISLSSQVTKSTTKTVGG